MLRSGIVLLLCLAVASGVPSVQKIYAAGSGMDMLGTKETVHEVIALSGKPQPRVLYLGTATYDAPAPQADQTGVFLASGCTVKALSVSVAAPPMRDMQAMFDATDIILVSGGNTLFARDRWVKLGIDKLINGAMAKGVVLSGGSAGAIVWFDGGHSDSMEPESYKNPPGPLLNPNATKEELAAGWAYIRVPGLNILPALLCPHYDMTGSNGVHRAVSFTGMLQHHSGEYAVGIDNWAALMIDGENYQVISREGKQGSVGPNGAFSENRTGVPGLWKLRITDTYVLRISSLAMCVLRVQNY
jgi:dipeptidase E